MPEKDSHNDVRQQTKLWPTGEDTVTARTTTTEPTRWWLAVASPSLAVVSVFAVAMIIGFLEGFGSLTPLEAEGAVSFITQLYLLSVIVTAVLAPIGVYQERSNNGSWTPHRAYYLSVIPGLNMLTGVVYTIHRYRND